MWVSDELNGCIRKFAPHGFEDDFRQELFLKLLSAPERIQEVYHAGGIQFYVTRAIINLVYESRSAFHRKYKTPDMSEYEHWMKPDIQEDIYHEEQSAFVDRIIERIEESEDRLNTPYYRLLADALMLHGSAGKVAKATGIPKSSVQQGIKKLRKYLNDE